ncbi:hypothetical protein [Ornithinibacillus bavariensis]|uniref:Uncharacterized protein n=1 Tax=Ornithinibacillus bavariensis TaxID=545502 RepID=A0A919X8S2_9BACI|nr:hypothetical protein [Ornithinibacillus bavariensis]GIO26178.1 hypothetical protein J43TS3_07890 [Ornithinibacillus bavariensis]HAM79418.1 hypothetical protein [Ornithinibacillus sp.]
MSWKSVEMQVALPRTTDAGKFQDQILKQNQHFQEALAQTQVIQENQKRKKVQEFEDIHLLKDDKSETNQKINQDQAKEELKTNNQNIQHPYLGNHFDSRS